MELTEIKSEPYKNFDYKMYLFLNPDVVPNISLNDVDCEEIKLKAWYHWINHGIYEERPTEVLNNTKTHNGRFGNLFFINMACHFISLKFNLLFDYKYKEKFERIGIYFYKGTSKFNNFIELTDNNFMEIIYFGKINGNLLINNNMWCQSSEFVHLIKLYWSQPFHKHMIMKHNLFKERYDKNNDLFIHVRLGDLENQNKHLEHYYINTLSKISWNEGYISSDSIYHSLCQLLIHKFNLKVVEKSEEETLMFGSTCNNIILSGGTFSWLIGFFAFFSENIYYPYIESPWYGRIFEDMSWKVIN